MSEAEQGRGGLIVVSICALVSLVILGALGTWQLQRLAWKEGIIAEIEQKQEAPAIDMAQALVKFDAGKDINLTKVEMRGQYEHGRELHLYSLRDGRQGWRIITPMILPDGKLVLVDRGYVPDELKSPGARSAGLPTGDVTVTGNVRLHKEEKGAFTPDNEPEANKWFWYDRTNMLAQVGDKMNLPSVPFFVQLSLPDHQGEWPQAVPVSVRISNSHFGYALTWYGLGAALLGVYGFYVVGWRKKRRKDAL
ncbi:MAG: SURF1 family protein [Hyphomicrobiales bacterium]